MRNRCLFAILIFLPLAVPTAVSGNDERAFDRTIAPILIRHCINCHNTSEPRGGLDLTQRASALKGGKSGPALVPGKASKSYLLERVIAGEMPPRKVRRRVTSDEIATLARWLDAGAQWPSERTLNNFELTTEQRAGYDWWSLQPLTRPAIPSIANAATPIDAFILDALQARKLRPANPADRRTMIRRVTFDLLGLPPTPDEIDAFVADPRPAAYERLIDRLLANPHYGERWGRNWLDVVRFTESDGFENDRLRDNAWRYRDYVIASLNDDRPYQQFVREQLAGDVLAPATRDGLAASGFLVAGPYDEVQNVGVSATERLRSREEQLEELLSAVGGTFLGLTVHCARCHDHKFDPIRQIDYYRLKAVFDGVDHGNQPFLLPDERLAHERRTAPLRDRLTHVKAELDQLGKQTKLPVLAEGRFGRALDARRSRHQEPAKAAWRDLPLTVECWVRLDSKAGFNIFVAHAPKESADHWELYSYAGTGDFSVYIPACRPAEIRSGVDVADGKWHYLAAAIEEKRVRLFVDGRLVHDASVTRPRAAPNPGPLWIGAYPPQNIGCAGLVDEVRISRGVRAVERLPEAAFPADDQTVGIWHFDDLPPGNGDMKKAVERSMALEAERQKLEAELASIAPPMVYSGTRRQPGATHVFLRGDIKRPGVQVTANGLSALRMLPSELELGPDSPESQRRIRFADWVAHPDNPLTARVLVNRIWQYHFGQGLVDTPSDFGFNGGRPSHPALLDWLAQAFLDGGGSVKRLHRMILCSAAYQQSSRFDAGAAAMDSDNRLLWRFPPRRLEGEIVRDAMLAVSGDLNRQIGGPSFRPFTVTVFLTHFYHQFDRGDAEFNRRTVYRANVNTGRSPLLDALDCPVPSVAAPRRRPTTTPLQALALMNDTFVVRQADRLAERVRRVAGPNLDTQVTHGYRLAFGRLPTAAERAAARSIANEHGLATVCWALLNASEFLYVH